MIEFGFVSLRDILCEMPIALEMWVAAVVVGLIVIALQLHKQYFLLLFLIFGTVIGERKFAYLHFRVGNVPLYITEIIIAVVIFSLLLRGLLKGKVSIPHNPLNRIYFFYYLVGIAALLRGGPYYGIEAVRDSVLVYYSIFYFFIIYIVRNFLVLKKILNVFFIAAVLATIYQLLVNFRIISFGPQGAANSMYLGMSVVFLYVVFPLVKKQSLRNLIGLVMLLQVIPIMLTRVRSVYIALLVSLLCVSALLVKNRLLSREHIRFWYAGVALMVILLLGVIIGMPVAKYTLLEAASIVFPARIPAVAGSTAGGNVFFRLAMWRELLQEVASRWDYLIFGFGFGKPFMPKSAAFMHLEWIDPHNSHLAILYRMGLLGFGVYIWLILRFLKECWDFLKQNNNKTTSLYVIGLLGAFILVLVHSTFSVILEGPYKGIFFWITMGLCIVVIKLSRKAAAGDNGVWNRSKNQPGKYRTRKEDEGTFGAQSL